MSNKRDRSLSRLCTSEEGTEIALKASGTPVHPAGRAPARPAVVMLSMWMNDAKRRLQDRVDVLLSKTYSDLRWVWLVGDSTDGTAELLADIVGKRFSDQIGSRVEILKFKTGLPGGSMAERLRRMSVTMSVGLDRVWPGDDYVVIHESDLESPPDLIERFVAHADAGKCPIAGWITLKVNPVDSVFYDIWGYRCNGKLFTGDPPYCDNYSSKHPFKVDSVGSVWMVHASDICEGVRMSTKACVEVCEKLRAKGRTIWVDSTIPIVQPRDLWEPAVVIP